MNLSKKQVFGIIALLILLTSTSVTFAVLYVTRNVYITGGVSVVGEIEVYEDDGTTLLESYDFPLFTGGVYEQQSLYFYINNTGNQPVNVYWNISDSSKSWTADEYGYISSPSGFGFDIMTSWLPDPNEYWTPNEYTTPEALYLDVDGSAYLRLRHTYIGSPNIADTYTLTMSFYAEGV